jgi:hypothetical protein
MASDASFHKRFGHRAERFSDQDSRFVDIMNSLSFFGAAGSSLAIIVGIIVGGYFLSPIPWPPPGWAILAVVIFAGGGVSGSFFTRWSRWQRISN